MKSDILFEKYLEKQGIKITPEDYSNDWVKNRADDWKRMKEVIWGEAKGYIQNIREEVEYETWRFDANMENLIDILKVEK